MIRTIPAPARAARLLGGAALLWSLSLAASAHAQQPPPAPLDPNSAEAAEQFLAGREALKKGELARAEQLFQRSQELHPAAGTLLNLASVEEQLRKTATALDLFQTALRLLPEGDERIPVAKEAIARLTPRLPYLKVQYAAGVPPTTQIAVDGAPLAATAVGTEQPTNPGLYTVVVSAPGYEARSYQVKLSDGQHLALVVEPGKVSSAQSNAGAPAARAGTNLKQSIGFALGGVGLAGLGIGAVSGILALGKKGDFDKACPDAAHCSAEGLQIEASGKALAGVSTASFVVGLVGLGAGVTLVLLGRDRGKPAAVSVGASPLPGGGFLGAHGAF